MSITVCSLSSGDPLACTARAGIALACWYWQATCWQCTCWHHLPLHAALLPASYPCCSSICFGLVPFAQRLPFLQLLSLHAGMQGLKVDDSITEGAQMAFRAPDGCQTRFSFRHASVVMGDCIESAARCIKAITRSTGKLDATCAYAQLPASCCPYPVRMHAFYWPYTLWIHTSFSMHAAYWCTLALAGHAPPTDHAPCSHAQTAPPPPPPPPLVPGHMPPVWNEVIPVHERHDQHGDPSPRSCES